MPLTQFPAESILLAVIGGIAGVLAGAVATAVYASSKGWAVVIAPRPGRAASPRPSSSAPSPA